MGGGYKEKGSKREKKWDNCNSIINKIYFKKLKYLFPRKHWGFSEFFPFLLSVHKDSVWAYAGEGGPLVLVPGNKGLSDLTDGAGALLWALWVNVTGACHTGNRLTPMEGGRTSLKLTTHATLLPLPSRIQEEASGSPLHHTVAEEDSKKLNAGRFILVGSPWQSPPRAQPSPSPMETSRLRSSHVLPLPLSPQRNSSEKEGAPPCSPSLLNGLPTSYPSSWDANPSLAAQRCLVCAAGLVFDVLMKLTELRKSFLFSIEPAFGNYCLAACAEDLNIQSCRASLPLPLQCRP